MRTEPPAIRWLIYVYYNTARGRTHNHQKRGAPTIHDNKTTDQIEAARPVCYFDAHGAANAASSCRRCSLATRCGSRQGG